MKKFSKYLLGVAALTTLSLSSCVEEILPEGGTATEGQVSTSPNAVKAMVLGMPARMNIVWDGDSHFSFGYGAQMVIRDMYTGDYMHAGEVGYSHFIAWARCKSIGQDYLMGQFIWNYYYGTILAANGVIGAVDEDNATEETLGYKAAGLAYRSMLYLDLARMYEFLPNEIYTTGIDGAKIDSLTVPIVTDKTTPAEAANNPRAPRREMAAFIENDLNNAEKWIGGLTDYSGRTLPDLACVYGLKARLYMWTEQYDSAQVYARKAINATQVKPITEAVGLSTTQGYNDASEFMWCAQQTAEDATVTSGIINWTSWTSNQTTFGYTGPATNLFLYIDKMMYNRINDGDWRKKQWVAPEGGTLDGQNTYTTSTFEGSLPEYASLKFRPGQGNGEDYKTGAAVAYPLMRVEEMYFIEAEAAEHVAAGTGVQLLEKFMKENRCPSYTFQGSDAIDEIVFQKRVELWGEGQTFFDIKRLDMSVTRGYKGTNWTDEQSRLNTHGRPAWMNYVMVKTESNNNKALVGKNNPDPTDVYKPWTEE